MPQATCLQLKVAFEKAREARDDFNRALEGGDFESASAYKGMLEARVQILQEALMFEKIFVKELVTEGGKLHSGMRQLAKRLLKAQENSHDLEEPILRGGYELLRRAAKRLFAKEETVPLQKGKYQYFLDTLTQGALAASISQAVKDAMAGAEADREFAKMCECDISAMLHAVFLNTFLKENNMLTICEQPPESIQEWFGFRFNSGTVYCPWSIKDECANSMEGGSLFIKETSHLPGQKMRGGTLFIEKSVNSIGLDMEGGTIYIRTLDAKNFLGVDDHLSVGRKGAGVIVFEDILHVRRMPPAGNVYVYDKKHGAYENLKDKACAPVIKDQDMLEEFVRRKEGIAVIEDASSVSSPTMGMSGGVLVLRQTPQHDIGNGMTGGIVIIEDKSIMESYNPKKRVEELRAKVSAENKGGFIFVRIQEPQNAEKTMLEMINIKSV